MDDRELRPKIGMAMTHAFNDISVYNDDLPLEVRQLSHTAEVKKLKNEIKDLKTTLEINKEMMKSVLAENDEAQKSIKLLRKDREEYMKTIEEQTEEISHLNDKCLILDQIKNFHENAAEEIEKQCEERIQDYIEQLDRKEYVIQMKENKWNEIEKIMSIYTKSDYILRDQLAQLRYLCDDTSSGRGISSVIKENEALKDQLKAAKKEIDSLINVIHDLQRCQDDFSLDEIIEEISDTSGGTGSGNCNQLPPKVPMLDLNIVKEKKKDKTNYKQLCMDQSKYINEVERINGELKTQNMKLIRYIKTKTMKYKLTAKDSINRIKVVKKKLEEYEGLNKSVFDTIENHEKIMELRDRSEISGRHSLFSQGSDISSIVVGGFPQPNKSPSFSNDDEIFAATGSSSQHRRSKSRPYMYKQKSDIRKQQLERLERDLEKINRRRPSFSKVSSNPSHLRNNFKDEQPNNQKSGAQLQIKLQQNEISDIRYPSERR